MDTIDISQNIQDFKQVFENESRIIFSAPPLEAMSVGAKCIIAKASCLPEIFGESAYWIDPYNTDIDLDELLSHDVASPEKVLNKYTFKRFAKIMHNALCGFS